jgi:energy-coupling factor transporter transmembrane protein EcfT
MRLNGMDELVVLLNLVIIHEEHDVNFPLEVRFIPYLLQNVQTSIKAQEPRFMRLCNPKNLCLT